MSRRLPVAVDFEEEILPSRLLRRLVVVDERDVQSIQHAQDLAIVSKLVTGFAGVDAGTRKHQHTDGLTIAANRPIQRTEDGLQLANPIRDCGL